MAKNKKVFNNEKALFFITLVVAIGIAITIVAVKQKTEYRQRASSFQDINAADQITQTNNPDGTMGPSDYTGNFSNTLPAAYLGNLSFQVTDPPQETRPADKDNQKGGRFDDGTPHAMNMSPTLTLSPTSTSPTQVNITPRQGEGKENARTGGPQSITSLMLTITKVEVHLAHLGIPGSRNEKTTISPTSNQAKPTGTPSAFTNQDVDKWEVLNIGAPKTIDLIQLAKNSSLSSLGITKLANGRYTEIRLYISTATATLQDGTKVALTIPGRANIVRIVQPFVINSSKITTLTIDFDAQNSVIKAGNIYILKPVVAHLLENDES